MYKSGPYLAADVRVVVEQLLRGWEVQRQVQVQRTRPLTAT